MCLAVIAWHSHPDYPLVLAANRDEFYTRRTRPAAWWGQSVSLLAGRDEEAGGTWVGVNRRGRFSMLTNVRAPNERNPHAPSRGALVVSALQSDGSVPAWADAQRERFRACNGFNLLVGNVAPVQQERTQAQGAALFYLSNRVDAQPRALASGIYGLSNAFLDTPWPKVTRAVGRFACLLARRLDFEQLLALMADREIARDRELPSTGVPLEWERVLSAIQIRANGYGTRATTILAVRADGLATFVERSFAADDPSQFSDRRFEFTIDQARDVTSGFGTGTDRQS